jgi:hypothetical protein
MLFRKTAVSVSIARPHNAAPIRPTDPWTVSNKRPAPSRIYKILPCGADATGGDVKSGSIFHYTSTNLRICSALKCTGYHSRKVETANATMDGAWGTDSNLGDGRILYDASHLCAQEPHL